MRVGEYCVFLPSILPFLLLDTLTQINQVNQHFLVINIYQPKLTGFCFALSRSILNALWYICCSIIAKLYDFTQDNKNWQSVILEVYF